MRARSEHGPAAAGTYVREVRSVTVLFAPLPDGNLPDAARIAAWLQEYDAAFKLSLDVPNGQGLHLLYGRTFNVLGPRLLEQLPAFQTLATAARMCGFSVGLQLKVGEVLQATPALAHLLDDRPMGTVYLDFRDVPDSGAQDAAALALVEALLSAGLSLTLLARPAVLARVGVFDSLPANAANLQIIPSADEPGVPAPALLPARPTGRRRRVIPIQGASDRPKQSFDPCATRMQFFIDPQGAVYPCQGLAGLQHMALCHVNTPFSSACLTEKGRGPELATWLAAGPPLPPQGPGPQGDVCERHRQQLEAMVVA